MKATLTVILTLLVTLVLVSACSDDDNATVSPSPTESSQPTQSAARTPTPSGTYSDDRFGYTVELPQGWRAATAFMDAYGELHARPQGVGNSEDYAVLTDLSADDETEFVQRVASGTPTGLTGIEPWLEFFLLRTVEIYPTDSTREELLNSTTQGNVKHVVTDVRDVELAGARVGTRYDLELDSDYGHFIYDAVYVPSEVSGCSDCTGFVLQTVIAGRTLQSPGPTEPPPAEYPKVEFEQIVSSFSTAGDPVVEPEAWGTWRFHGARLPASAAYHGMLVPLFGRLDRR
ncbi:MAG TPA: hypothetical protein VMT24_19350 [Aggregatilineaceae bacterium]|jgi:hypothetical protein|nr:hypothetical protein [Aggregatilineaceae bacterium]